MADPKGNLVTPVGHRSDGTIHSLELDNSDRLKVLIDAITGSLSIIAADMSYLNPIGAGEIFENLSLPAGTSVQAALVVAAGERYQLDHFTFRYNGTVAGVTVRPYFERAGVLVFLSQYPTIVSGQYYPENISMVLEDGDTFGFSVTGATLNDDFRVYLIYRRIKPLV